MTPQTTNASEWISLVMVLTFMVLLAGLVVSSRLPKVVKWLTCIALGMRVVGAVVRYEVLYIVYHGVGDARGYYGKGLQLAQSFKELDFSPLFLTGMREWYGTLFVRKVSGFVLTVIGPSMFTEYVVFSLFSFVGLAAFGWAFHRAYPDAPVHRYLVWIWLFPSLWYWPSSVGKEALLVMGLGIAVMGFVGRNHRIHWLPLVGGSVLTFAVRPELTIVLILCIILAQWLAFDGRWTAGRLGQAAMLLVIGLVALKYTMESIGLQEFDIEGVQSYVEEDAGKKAEGGTSVDPVSLSPTGIPMAAMNVLFRPFPWEASSKVVLLSSLEILSLWAIVFYRRRNLMRSLQHWRTDRFLRLSLVFILIYSVSLGLMLVNIGIIARQRIFLLPFIFLLIEAIPRPGASPPRASRPAVGANRPALLRSPRSP